MIYDDELKFEHDLIKLLYTNCGWDKEIIMNPTEDDLINNFANILFENNKEKDLLNNCPLTESEIAQIITQINMMKNPVALNGFINGKTVSIRRDNPNDKLHLGKNVSLKIYDRMEIAGGKSRYQIAEQPRFTTNNEIYPARRGDFMLLINGMPLFHIELKKTGIPISQATNQIKKYMKSGVYTGIFSLVQIFVAMNPEDAVYFANPGFDGNFNPDFFFHWEDFNNVIIYEWKEFAKRVLSIPMAHQMIGFYTIADESDGILKVMRSYQYYAASRISSTVAMTNWTKNEQYGGYVWHTTGSGKTMTSFKAAQLIANSKDADKVVFLLDRVELGLQSLINYRNFADDYDSIQATEDTDVLEAKLKSPNADDTLIVTSIQKMSRIKDESEFKKYDLDLIRKKRIVFIIDECHRSQIGKMHQDIKDTFPNAIYFGFTGTPDYEYTSDIFGDELHRYTLFHGIRDKNVLGFDPIRVSTYNDQDLRKNIALDKCHVNTVEEALKNDNTKKVFMYYMNQTDKKCSMIEIEKSVPESQYTQECHQIAVVKDISDNWLIRSVNNKFHSLFATSSIFEAIRYYRLFKKYNSNLKITAIFDPSDDNSDTSIDKIDGITEILTDYNNNYGFDYTIGSYSKFKKDVCLRLAHKKPYIGIDRNSSNRIDLVIVVNQLLTGFDSKWINTLYLDKWLEGKNFIQAISRTNRLCDDDKPHGTIIWYRYPYTMEYNLNQAIKDYSGDVPTGLFVNKLDININNMNLKYHEIISLFDSQGIQNFSRISDDITWRKKFAKVFSDFNKYFLSAKIQGFRWNKLEYIIIKTNGDKVKVVSEVNESIYLTLIKRYKEMFGSGKGFIEDLPYDIDSNITEIPTDSIDDEYMNSRFQIYLKKIELGDEESKSKALDELHKTFAMLNQQEQKYADIFLHDLESGNIVVESNKTFRDYIIEYAKKINNDYIHQFASNVGINETILRDLLSLNLDSHNFNEYGRYDDLMETLDIDRAQIYYENKLKKELSKKQVKILADDDIRTFIINSGIAKI